MDIKTLLFTNSATASILTLLIYFLWLQNRKKMEGIGFWTTFFLLSTISQILMALRGVIPDFISIVISYFLGTLGLILLLIGLEKFFKKESKQLHNYIFLIFTVIAQYYFYVFYPSLSIRSINLSFSIIFICAQCIWLITRRIDKYMKPIASGINKVFILFILTNIIRIAENIIMPATSQELFKIGTIDGLNILIYSIVEIWLAFALNLMVNKYLLSEIKISEEKFSNAFQFSPYAIILTRMSDGKIFDVNDEFVKKTGYTKEEAIGKSVLELNLWDNKEDREKMINSLMNTGRIRGLDYMFRMKSGEKKPGLFSAVIIKTDNDNFILSSISDIANIKEKEDLLKKHVEELEKINKFMTNREIKMAELKEEIEKLKRQQEK